jgi:hypothetical protein
VYWKVPSDSPAGPKKNQFRIVSIAVVRTTFEQRIISIRYRCVNRLCAQSENEYDYHLYRYCRLFGWIKKLDDVSSIEVNICLDYILFYTYTVLKV